MIVPDSAKGSDGRGVAATAWRPSRASFSTTRPGEVGGLQRRMFSGPWTFDLDFGVLKTTSIREHQTLEFRMESTNFPNHPSFYVSDQRIKRDKFRPHLRHVLLRPADSVRVVLPVLIRRQMIDRQPVANCSEGHTLQ